MNETSARAAVMHAPRQNLSLMRSVVEGVEFLKDNVPDEANMAMTEYAFSLGCAGER